MPDPYDTPVRSRDAARPSPGPLGPILAATAAAFGLVALALAAGGGVILGALGYILGGWLFLTGYVALAPRAMPPIRRRGRRGRAISRS